MRKRSGRIRGKVLRRAGERHVLSVFRSSRHIYAQILEPGGKTLCGYSTLTKALRSQGEKTGNIEAAKRLGKYVAEQALARGLTRVVFNRNGHLYHGRVKALAEAAREAGLQF